MKVTIVSMLALFTVLTACDPKESRIEQPQEATEKAEESAPVAPLKKWNVEDCWTVFHIEAGGDPHAQTRDEFCTEFEDTVLVLTPGDGMDDWSPCGTASKIALVHLGGPTYRFCAHVDPHDTTHPKDHTNFHITFHPPSGGHQQNHIVAIGGGVGTGVHGGTAHSQN